MRLPPSVISLIESHIAVPQAATRHAQLKALAPTLQSLAAPAPNAGRPRLSVRAALQRHPRTPSVALAIAHRLLTKHASEPSTSSRITYLVRRQRIYERLIRTFTAYPSTEWITIASIFQRMMEEGTPPNLDTLKIVLSAAMRNGMPVMPIIQKVVQMDGLPDKMDNHLLVLVLKGLVREGGMKAKSLAKLVEELRQAETSLEDGSLDEILVEAYGQEGDMRGILDTISRHRLAQSHSAHPDPNTTQHSAALALYLQALKQWVLNAQLRRKRRGSIFPRILAKDVVEIYGGTQHLPLIWLNAWMNAERMCGDVKAALAIWGMIGNSADQVSYTTYFKLSKLLSTEDASLRSTVNSLLHPQGKIGGHTRVEIEIEIETLESALSASFHHHDLPLSLHLARLLNGEQRLTDRTIDLIASGIIKSRRSTQSRNHEFITQHEWDTVSQYLDMEDIVLPLGRPQARLSGETGEAGEDTLVKTFTPDRIGLRTGSLQRVMGRLVGLLEEAVVEQYSRGRPDQSRDQVLRSVMSDLHREILPE